MEVASSSPSLRHKLRTTVCCCFGASGGERRGAGGDGDGRVRWRRRGAAGEFRYDPLSYALNFDEGGDDEYGDGADDAAPFRYRNFSSRLPPSPAPAQRPTVIAIA